MNKLQIFENAEFGSVRTTTIDGEPYFVGKDVATILGYSNPRDAISKHIDDEDKGVAKCDTLGGRQEILFINESGLYSLILRSQLPAAKKFKRWVTSEVLPSIRKTGGYVSDDEKFISTYLPNADEATKLMFRTNLETIKNLNNKVGVLETENALQKQQISELQPKASYYDVCLNCKDLLSITEIAKDYGKSGRWLNDKLHELGIQYKQGRKIWLLYQKYAERGYTSTKTQTYNGNDGEVHIKAHTYWTQKGRLFIYDKLKSNDILPLIEQQISPRG